MDALIMSFSMHFDLSPFLCPHSMSALWARYAQKALDFFRWIVYNRTRLKNCIGLFETIQSLNKTRDLRAASAVRMRSRTPDGGGCGRFSFVVLRSMRGRMKMKRMNTKTLTRAAVIAALYAVLTLVLAPISYGAMQVRVSEGMTLLPVLFPEAVPALFIGCLLANILGGCALPDIVFGSIATLLAAMATRALRVNKWLAALPPVVLNGLIVGALVHVLYTPEIPLPLCMLYVAVGEAIACYIVGMLLVKGMERVPERLKRP